MREPGGRACRLYATPVLGRSVLLNIAGQVATLLIGFVPSVLVARWLGPTDRGLLAVIGTTTGVAFILACVGLPMAVLYFASEKTPPTAGLLGNSLAFGAALACVFVIPTWIFRHELADLLSQHRGETAWVLAAVGIPLTFLDWTTHNQLLGRLRFGYYNVLIVAQKVVGLVVIVLLLRVLDLGVTGVFIASIAGSVFVIGGSLASILRDALPRLDRQLFRKMLSYGRKTQFGSIFQYFNSRFDVLILQFFVPLACDWLLRGGSVARRAGDGPDPVVSVVHHLPRHPRCRRPAESGGDHGGSDATPRASLRRRGRRERSLLAAADHRRVRHWFPSRRSCLSSSSCPGSGSSPQAS